MDSEKAVYHAYFKSFLQSFVSFVCFEASRFGTNFNTEVERKANHFRFNKKRHLFYIE